MTERPLTACVPCYNCQRTIAAALASVRTQTVSIDDVIVIDDGSTDGSAAIARAGGARVVSLGANLGRGAARARGILEARHELVLFLDASLRLPGDFAAAALRWFDDPAVAAVHARIEDPEPAGLIGRWRARHLFKSQSTVVTSRRASLSTGGCLLRRACVVATGNFDAQLRAGEDADLGRRLLAAGFDVVSDPSLRAISSEPNTLTQVLERYWRWADEPGHTLSLRWYIRQVAYSVKIMARQDLAAGDPMAVPISLLIPHYQFWRTLLRRFNGTSRLRVPADE